MSRVAPEPQARPEPTGHPLWVRVAHWVVAGAFVALTVSGCAILLALPKLFWGEVGSNGAPAWLALPLPINTDQTGWGRNLHFLSAWIFVITGGLYVAALVAGGRLFRRLAPAREQLRPRHLIEEIRAHTPFTRTAASEHNNPGYNALQKLAYLAVIFVLAPVMLLSGLTMSPGVTTAYPELFALFGGRQSARTVHFLSACLLLGFLVIHVWQVAANNPRRLLSSIILGRPPSKRSAK